jgi:general secretion pathway protein K
MRLKRRDERGLILMVVLVFALLLATSVATFTRRAVVDTAISRNRDARAQAEALARGGVELAKALLLEDILQDENSATPGLDTHDDLWAQIGEQVIELEDGARLRIRIEDVTTRLNINAVIGGQGEESQANDNAEPLLAAILEKIIDEMPYPPGEKVYDQSELVENLIDYVDGDDERLSGGEEESVYDYRPDLAGPSNLPLLSVDEIRNVEGFDSKLVEAMRPYVTVYPYAGDTGVNLNTAPPHVLALLYFDDGVELNLAKEEVVRQILRVRQEDGFVCDGQSAEGCTPIGEIVTNDIFPPPTYQSNVFTIVAEAQVGDVARSIEVVVDRKQAPQLVLLSWRVL